MHSGVDKHRIGRRTPFADTTNVSPFRFQRKLDGLGKENATITGKLPRTLVKKIPLMTNKDNHRSLGKENGSNQDTTCFKRLRNSEQPIQGRQALIKYNNFLKEKGNSLTEVKVVIERIALNYETEGLNRQETFLKKTAAHNDKRVKVFTEKKSYLERPLNEESEELKCQLNSKKVENLTTNTKLTDIKLRQNVRVVLERCKPLQHLLNRSIEKIEFKQGITEPKQQANAVENDIAVSAISPFQFYSQLDKGTDQKRHRLQVNYAELTFEDSLSPQAAGKSDHMPIYKQKIPERKPAKVKDPFEFVPELPVRKKGSFSESDSYYDTSMHKLLQTIRKREKRLAKKNQTTKAKNLTKKKKTNKKIEISNAQHIYLSDSKKVTSLKASKNKQRIVKRSDLEKSSNSVRPIMDTQETLQQLRRRIFQLSRRNTILCEKASMFEQKDDNCDRYFGFDESTTDELPKNESTELPFDQDLGHKEVHVAPFTSTPLARRNENVTQRRHVRIISNVLISPPSNRPVVEVVKSFGDSENAEPANLLLETFSPEACTSRGNFERCNSGVKGNNNSDGLRGFVKRKATIENPWRSDDVNVVRNPHFLWMKNTSLPCYNQDMILEPKLVEKSSHTGPVSETVQTNILNFVNGSVANSTPSKTRKTSLFNDDSFSPIKPASTKENVRPTTRNSNCTQSKENVNENENSGREFKTRRTIFKSPLKTLNQNKLSFDIDNYFGFDSYSQEDGEDVEKISKAHPLARPMRMVAKDQKKVRNEAVKKLLENGDKLKNVEMENNKENVEVNVATVGLFEDLDDVKSSPRVYESKKTKRIRRMVIDSNEAEKEQRKRRKKDIRTKAEKQAMKQWINKFNAMCTEVEKHDLDID